MNSPVLNRTRYQPDRAIDDILEKRILELFSDYMGFAFRRMRRLSKLDAFFYRIEDADNHNIPLAALGEVKSKKADLKNPNSLIIDLDKYLNLFQAGLLFEVPAYYIVANLSGIWFADIREVVTSECKITICGRTDRNDDERKPALFIPISYFTRIEGSEIVYQEND